MITNLNAGLLTLLLFMPLLFGVVLKKKKLLTENLTCYLIILSGLAMRLLYISYTGVYTRQNDVFQFFADEGGHGRYICYLYENRHLPDFDPREIWQFYHPPLHHIICAVWITVLETIGIPARFAGVHSLPILTTIYSSFFMIFAYKAFKRLDFKSNTLYLCTALIAFHPAMIILSGSVNNDMLSSLFSMMAIYSTIKWSQERKWIDIIMIAFSVGLGMLTKLSVGLIAPAIAMVFLIVLFRQRKEFKRLIPQFFVFAVICLPLGLYWMLRNYIKYNMPLAYVPAGEVTDGRYIHREAFERLTDWSLYQFSSPFIQFEGADRAYNEFNPFIALLKTSLFDQDTFFRGNVALQSVCEVLFFLNIILTIVALIAMIYTFVKNKEVALEIKTLLGVLFAMIFGNFVTFCINYPFICTQHVRYCIPLIFVGVASFGMFIDKLKQKKSKVTGSVASVLTALLWVFCALSVFIYTVLMFYLANI